MTEEGARRLAWSAFLMWAVFIVADLVFDLGTTGAARSATGGIGTLLFGVSTAAFRPQGSSAAAGSARHSARRISRSKRACRVSAGVKALKSCLPTSARAHSPSAARSSSPAHHSARPPTSALRARR